MQMRRAVVLLATLAAAVLLAAWPAAATLSAPVGATVAAAQQGETVDATIIDFNFEPKPLRIEAGTTVRWTNTGARPHTATDRGGTFDTKPISPGKTGQVTFSVPGRYQYFCRINPAKMNGEVIVTAGDEPAKVNRIQALDPALPGKKLSFDPSKLEVAVGSTILLANVGGKPHTITADDGSFDSGVVTPGAEGGRFAGTNATVTLSKAGTFPFHCEIHPGAMKGVLTVTGEEGEGQGDAGGGEQARVSNAPAKVSIDMQDFAFKPPEISVAPGGKVTWKNTGQAPHTATFDDIPLDTKNIDSGGDATLTAPTKPGSYSYKCNIHPGQMRAVLVVVGQNIADPTAKNEAGGGGVAKAAATAEDGGGGDDGGGGGGVSWFALTTGVLGAFAAGFGISAFVRGRSDAN